VRLSTYQGAGMVKLSASRGTVVVEVRMFGTVGFGLVGFERQRSRSYADEMVLSFAQQHDLQRVS